jgi:ABC-type transport system involved in multi-copper enzyme maturation permease subunit
MAVFEREYRPYEGELTPPGRRWLAIARAAWADVAESRLYVLALAACFIPPVVVGLLIYLRHNVTAIRQLELSLADLIAVDAELFLQYMAVQTMLTFLVALLIGPALIAADLADGALPLYLSRPISRSGYLFGKAALLVVLLSLVTWVPALVLIGLQASLEGLQWLVDHIRLVPAVVAAAWLWIAVLTLLVLAVSSLVQRRLPARVLLLALFYVPAAMGTAVNETLDTHWGSLLSLGSLMQTVWRGLFDVRPQSSADLEVLGGRATAALPAWSAWLVIGLICGLCLVVLRRRVRAVPEVRS